MRSAQKKIGKIPTTVEVENRLIFIRDKNHLSDGSLLMKPGKNNNNNNNNTNILTG
jgi:hypothetical protein